MRNIRKLELAMTQAEFAKRLDVNQSTVSRWERGTLEPSRSDLAGIHQLLLERGFARPMEWIIDEAKPRDPRPKARLKSVSGAPTATKPNQREPVVDDSWLDYHMERTTREVVSVAGVGLHTGANVSFALRPAEPGTGIRFRRMDMDGAEIPANWECVSGLDYNVELSDGDGVRIASVEHLMAALLGFGIDNAIIEVKGPELPAIDGSAGPFAFLIERAGVVTQEAPRRYLKIARRVSVEDERGGMASLSPADQFSISVKPGPGEQRFSYQHSERQFRDEICRARTFGSWEEIQNLMSLGAFGGVSGTNVLVIPAGGEPNKNDLRYADEPVRHKVLDTMGDLALAGAPILGRYEGVRCDHALNNKLLRRFMKDRDAWRWASPNSQTRGMKLVEDPSGPAQKHPDVSA